MSDFTRAEPSVAARPARAVALRRWSVAVSVYLLAIFHRTSLGVAGLQASNRFHIGPSELSVFVLLQLGVYASMQVPTGILVDRYGPRRLLIAASLTMGSAQLVFAVADNYPLALLARAMLGCGDALTFVSVLRFAAGQFSPRRYPIMVTVTAALGQLGNVIATVPLSASLRSAGWTPTFAVAGSLSLLTGAAVYRLLPASAPAPTTQTMTAEHFSAAMTAALARVRAAWSMAGTRAGFWLHFTTMSTTLMFGVLWGVPFMVQGEGMSRSNADATLLGSVLFGVVAGPLIGFFITRRPATRVPLALGIVVLTISGWLFVLLAFSAGAPRPLLIGLIVFTGIGGPASGIGFALARDYNGPSVIGTATGVVNVGGFVAGTFASLCVGWTLDLIGSTDRNAYRSAFTVAIGIQFLGLLQMTHWWLRARSSSLKQLESGNSVPVPLVRRPWDLD